MIALPTRKYCRELIATPALILELAIAVCMVVAVLTLASPASAQTVVDPEHQGTVLLRTLAYDRALPSRTENVVIIGILGASEGAFSEYTKEIETSFERLQDRTVQGLPISVVRLEWADEAALRQQIEDLSIDVLYIGPGLEESLPSILNLTRVRKLATMTGVKSYVNAGVSIGVIPKGNASGLLINLEASRAEGMRLDARLLRLATVLR